MYWQQGSPPSISSHRRIGETDADTPKERAGLVVGGCCLQQARDQTDDDSREGLREGRREHRIFWLVNVLMQNLSEISPSFVPVI